jgi:FtsZ-binding cell division protein ZapB
MKKDKCKHHQKRDGVSGLQITIEEMLEEIDRRHRSIEVTIRTVIASAQAMIEALGAEIDALREENAKMKEALGDATRSAL